jgi:hypothetical protein
MAEGTTTSRTIEGISRMIQRPHDAVRWIREKMVKGGSPLTNGLPWTSWKAIDYLARLDLRDKVVYEYGGGGSTIFFASRGARVITNETHAQWTSLVLDEAKRRGLADRITLATFEINTPESKAQYLDHIRTVGPWDIVLLDGYDTDFKGGAKVPITRMECVPAIKATARPGCIVLLDDSWRPTYASAPTLFAPAKRIIMRSLGPHRRGVTQTDVYTF